MNMYRGSGHADLKAFHGTAVSKYVGRNRKGIFEYAYKKQVPAQGGGFIDYLPNLANMNLLYCMDNDISSMHMAPRTSLQITTLCLGMLYKLVTVPDAVVVIKCSTNSNFNFLVRRLQEIYNANKDHMKTIGEKYTKLEEIFGCDRIINYNKWIKNEEYINSPAYIFVDDMAIQPIEMAWMLHKEQRKVSNVRAVFFIGTYLESHEGKICKFIDELMDKQESGTKVCSTMYDSQSTSAITVEMFKNAELFWNIGSEHIDPLFSIDCAFVKTDYINVYGPDANRYLTDTSRSLVYNERVIKNELLLQRYCKEDKVEDSENITAKMESKPISSITIRCDSIKEMNRISNMIHEQLVGNEDYIDTNILLSSDSIWSGKCSEYGVCLYVFKECKDDIPELTIELGNNNMEIGCNSNKEMYRLSEMIHEQLSGNEDYENSNIILAGILNCGSDSDLYTTHCIRLTVSDKCDNPIPVLKVKLGGN